MRRLLVPLILMLVPAMANAEVQPFTNAAIFDDALSAVALNASPGTRTITQSLAVSNDQHPGYSKARLYIDFTWAAATTVTVVFKCSVDGTHYHQIGGRDVSGGASTVTALTDTWSTGGASGQVPMLEYEVRGCKSATWLFGGASAGSSDKVTVDVVLVAGS